MRFLLAALLAISAANGQPASGVVVISHRGEHLKHPENTLPAYRAALEAGADFIETDVRTSADGKLVIMHDGSVDRRTDGHGEIARMTFAEIRKLDAGAKSGDAFRGTPVPTFDEVLEFARGKIGVYIDAKQISAADLVDAVKRFGMEARVVVYGGLELLRGIQKLEPRIKLMPEAGSAEGVARLIAELHPRVLAFDAHDFTDEILALVRQANAGIYVDRLGPLDTPEAWEAAVRHGATGIQTDRPAELTAFLRARKLH